MRVRTALLTGATSGIGEWTALGLLRANVAVMAVARDRARGTTTEAWLRARVPDADLTMLYADLGSLAEVRRLAGEVAARGPLGLLVNNAGLFTRTRMVTVDGIERTLAVNHVAPFVLTRELIPALTEGGGKVVNVGSSASDRATLAIDDLNLTKGWSSLRAYSQSKLAILMQTFDYARRLEAAGVTVNCCHPGVVATRIGEVGGPIGLLWKLGSRWMLTPEQGAEVTLHLCLDAGFAQATGKFFKRGGMATPNKLALDHALTERLWTATERLAGA